MASPLAFLGKILRGGRGPSVIGVDTGSSALKMVQLRKEGGRVALETYGSIALGPYKEQAVGQAVTLPMSDLGNAAKDLMQEAKVTSRDSGVAVQLQASLITLMPLPVLPEQKLQSMIPLEARKYIPVPINEVLLDWHLLPTREGKEQQEALLVAIHKDVINQMQSFTDTAGLSTSFYEIEAFSTVRAVLDRGIKPVMIIDMGARSTKLYIVEAGIIRSSHTINQGGQDITHAISQANSVNFEEAEKMKLEGSIVDLTQSGVAVLEYMFSEIKRVMLYYERKYNTSLTEVVLTGGGSLLSGFVDRAAEALDSDVRVADPFSKVESPAFLEEMLVEAGPEFAVAIGLALRKLEELR